MVLSAGEKLGPYELLSPIGAGGMGEVWKARDTRLNRIVAVKVSKDQFTDRFLHEARAIAALNHPNICTLHDVGPNYLVMEFIEGTSPRGPVPLQKAVEYCVQILDALDAAHRKGFTHRDLKPANILVTKQGIKLLDFGLAKQSAPLKESDETLTEALTKNGQIVGTLQYIAPEQLQGKDVDARSDLFAFGCVLYEMLTGKRAFNGASAASVIAAILEHPAPSVDKVATPAMDRVLKRCLEKDPDDRWQTARDLKEAMQWVTSTGAQPAHGGTAAPARNALPWALAAVAVLIAAGLGFTLWRATQPVDKPMVQLSVDLGPEAILGLRGTIAVSPDGQRIAYPARLPGGQQGLAVRILSQTKGTPLAGTDGATLPVFSPDGLWLAFFADGKLKKISVLGGAPLVLCEAPNGRGLSWGDDGNLVFVPNNVAGLSRVPAAGGPPEALTRLKNAFGGGAHRWPFVLPGSSAVLFTSNRLVTDWDQANIEVFPLPKGPPKIVQRGGYAPRYLPTGHLVFVQQGTLFGAAFDESRLELKSAPVPLLPEIAAHSPSGGGQYDISRDGTLVFLAGKPEESRYPFGWMPEGGKLEPLSVPAASYSTPRLSPDGKRLAVTNASSGDIWIFDLERGTSTRLTHTSNGNRYGAWTPDGKHIAYTSNAPNGQALWWVRADGAGSPVLLIERPNGATVSSISPDGRTIAIFGGGMFLLPLDLTDPDRPKPGAEQLILPSGFQHTFSPDGRWIAYTSLESSSSEVYVMPAPGRSPGVTGKFAISSGGGKHPVWSRGGRQLFYSSMDNYVMVAGYSVTGDTFAPSKPRRWSENPISNATGAANFDVAPDGKRIIGFPPTDQDRTKGNLHLTFVFNFLDEVKRRIPR